MRPFVFHPKWPTLRRGFTLVEIIVALLILSVGLLSVLAMTLAGVRSSVDVIGLATAQATARAALYDPGLVESGKTRADASASGPLNGYFIERTSAVATMGHMYDVTVRVYWGESGKELAGIHAFIPVSP